MSTDTLVTVVTVSLTLILAAYSLHKKGNWPASADVGSTLPPGPKGLPIVHALFELPKEHIWEYFAHLHAKYGPIVTIKVLNQTLISIGDLEVARDVLERKAVATSSRAENYLFTTMHRKRLVSHNGDPKDLSVARKLFVSLFQEVKDGKVEPLQEFEATFSVARILEDPAIWVDEMQRYTTSVGSGPIYGFRADPSNENSYIERTRYILDELVQFASPACSIVNLFPKLDPWIPNCLAPWRTWADNFTPRYEAHVNEGGQAAIENSKKGINSWLWKMLDGPMSKLLQGSDHLDACWIANELVLAGSETTMATLQTWIACLMLYEDKFEAAKEELDRVVGDDRLPGFHDRADLKQVEATVRETIRFRTPVPTGVPHAATQPVSVSVNGKEYCLPEGSLIFGTSWVIDKDPARFAKPFDFEPSQQFEASGNFKEHGLTAFGFGRRICPGQPHAERTLFIMAAILLWLFDFEPVEGKEPVLSESGAFGSSISSIPKAFDCRMRPRSDKRKEVALREFDGMDKDMSHLMSH